MGIELVKDTYLEWEAKILTRDYIYVDEYKTNGRFVEVGQMADGHKSYSILNDNNEVVEEDAGMFVQIRYNNKLVMYRI